MSEAARTSVPPHLTQLTRHVTLTQALRCAHLMVEHSGLLPAVEAVLPALCPCGCRHEPVCVSGFAGRC
ncbi:MULTISPECIES: hypothetical protein [unclassified Streptomyces]|uniref:hypothetical protein n=1 Tax=unclassified Streptomyces TaxID=2593676 RepID=UPI00324A073E